MGRSTVASIKQNRKKLVLGASVLASMAVLVWGGFFTFLSAHAVEEERLTAISQNCSTIKQSLSQLQRVDSRTRTYLGSAYEAILTKFITPLNLRLTRNNREVEQLFAIQSDFSAEQARFRTAYTEYMRELEGLIATDCSAHPDTFYQHLETIRTKRADLKATTVKLSELANAQYQAVLELKESL